MYCRLYQLERDLSFDGKRYHIGTGYYDWQETLELVLTFEKHVDLQIWQSTLPPIPNYFETRLADDDGQIEDYGYALDDGKGIHLKVYREGFYRIHWDAKDPNKNPLGHLVHDAPKYLVAGLVTVGIIGFGYAMYKKSQRS